jgi:hypothetical protein
MARAIAILNGTRGSDHVDTLFNLALGKPSTSLLSMVVLRVNFARRYGREVRPELQDADAGNLG